MPIRMRTNTKADATCCECGQPRNKVLEMFDIQVGGNIFTICDLCNEALFYKTLRATCNVNGKVKTKQDMYIIHQRGRDRLKVEQLRKTVTTDDNTKINSKHDAEAYEKIKKTASYFNGEGDDD